MIMDIPKSKPMEDKKTSAIDYINHSTIFTNSRYTWIIPLITKVLGDDLCDNDIDVMVDSFLSKKKIKSEPIGSGQPKSKLKIENVDDSYIGIKKLKSIDKILNIGLLEVNEPIVLKDGLNVFYGKNGAGKSSIYLGLCKVLGKNKKICSNIASKSNKSHCKITYMGDDSKDYPLEWDSSEENEESKVMIFDSLISSYIVEQDQENQFKMAHLKMEYFSFLYELFQKVETKLNLELGRLNTEYDGLEQALVKKASFVFENDFDWDEKKINKTIFTKEDDAKLTEFVRQIKVLEKNNPDAVIRNIENSLEETESILSVFGELSEEENGDGEIEDAWKHRYSKHYFEEINKQIEEYSKAKKAFEKSGKNKISSLIPPAWIDDETWEDFISSSIDFLNSLDVKEISKYTKEACVYCHQPLQTKEAKALIKAYQELYEEHKGVLEEKEAEFKIISDLMGECVATVERIVAKNKKIEVEFDAIGKKGQISFNFGVIKNIFLKYQMSIAKARKIQIDDADIKNVKEFWNLYKELSISFKSAIAKLNKQIKDKDKQIKMLEAKAEPLKGIKILDENKEGMLKCCKLQGLKKVLSDKISVLAPLRQATSTLKTDFTNVASLKEFIECLKDEYKYFSFSPPQTWNIAPATRGGVNKRVYSIGDRRLSEIFSEGEKKLHALSDFFAQCKLNKYKGVFIFDDPVNSLDEDNIEVVADRIIKLAEDGNQIIVFTHNLYFLNSVIDTQKEKITKVERNNNQINLIKELKIGETQELKDRLNKIDSKMTQLSKKKPEEIDEYDLRTIYDIMSGYLEDYVEKIYFKNIINRYRPNIRMQSLGNLKDLDTSVIDSVMKLYEQTSRRGSRHSQPRETKKPGYGELVGDVKKLKDHFKCS